jgi:hypothetical protein
MCSFEFLNSILIKYLKMDSSFLEFLFYFFNFSNFTRRFSKKPVKPANFTKIGRFFKPWLPRPKLGERNSGGKKSVPLMVEVAIFDLAG